MLTSAHVIQSAHEAGFELAGIASVGPVADYSRYQDWVEKGMAGKMGYLTDNRAQIRADVRNLLPSARSVLCVGKRYNNEYEPQAGGRVSRYAAGRDYHFVLKEALQVLVDSLLERELFEYQICIDSAALLERSLAHQAGLGWIGKNTCLINEPAGSWFFLAEVLVSLEFDSGTPPPDRCGSCTRCIEACPTQAIVPADEGWLIDARRCISYLTIELRGPIPADLEAGVGDHVFGCDICQEVCPWNAKAPLATDGWFAAPEVFAAHVEDWGRLTKPEFRTAFGETPVARARYDGFRRNLDLVRRNSGEADQKKMLEQSP